MVLAHPIYMLRRSSEEAFCKIKQLAGSSPVLCRAVHASVGGLHSEKRCVREAPHLNRWPSRFSWTWNRWPRRFSWRRPWCAAQQATHELDNIQTHSLLSYNTQPHSLLSYNTHSHTACCHTRHSHTACCHTTRTATQHAVIQDTATQLAVIQHAQSHSLLPYYNTHSYTACCHTTHRHTACCRTTHTDTQLAVI